MDNKERTLRLAVLLLFGSAALAACITRAPLVQSIRIANATYSVQDRTIPCDVTTKVANVCNGLAGCGVLVQNALCPMGDPAPMKQKLLTVEYTCGAAGMFQAEILEGKVLNLTCPP